MSERIGETVNVVAVFDPAPRPAKFKWRGKIYPVKEVTYRWTSKEGSAAFTHFSVTDGASLYELAYNHSTMKWSLEEVEA
ncbi:MAG: hypothetical protein ACE5GY_03090 [Thermodesulfobacteriota bacterium]